MVLITHWLRAARTSNDLSQPAVAWVRAREKREARSDLHTLRSLYIRFNVVWSIDVV